MQVFKLFFKVLKSQLAVFVMYTAIFLGIILAIIIPSRTQSDTQSYTDQKVKFAVMDNDNSSLSKGLIGHLEEAEVRVEIPSFEKETLQDELYARNIRAAVVIEKGFEDAIKTGNTDEYLKIYDIPDNAACELFSSEVTEYLRYVNGYLKADFSLDKAIEKANEITMKSADVTIAGAKNIAGDSALTVYFQYLGWIMIVMMAIAIAPILIVINKEEVRKRIECSSFEYSRTNLQIHLGVLLTGLAVCAIYVVVAKCFFGNAFSGIAIALHSVNLVCFTSIGLALAFFLSKLSDNSMVLNMVGNVVGLGMSFLCGVFIPRYLLSEAVLSAARFLPTYWYVEATSIIELYTPDKLPNILQCYGIELLFAAVLIIAGLVVGNTKRQKA